MTKPNNTFASKAKRLINRYKRADFDKTEKAELEAALEQLSQEQEAYKQANGIDQEQSNDQFATGGPWRPAKGYSIPQDFYDNNVLNTRTLNDFGQFADSQNMLSKYGNDHAWGNEYDAAYNKLGSEFNSLMNPALLQSRNIGTLPSNVPNMNSILTTFPINNSIQPPLVQDNNEVIPPTVPEGGLETFDPYQTSIVPQIASAGIGMIGDLYLANRAKKATEANQFDPGSIQPNLISLAKARESARRDYGTAASIAKRNLRTAGSRGAYLSGTGAAVTGLTQAKEQAITGLYGKEADYNAQAKNQAMNYNIQLQNQGDMFNIQNRMRGEADQQAYISSAFQTIPKMVASINASRQRDAMINYIGEEYGIGMEKGRKWYQSPKYRKTLNTNIRK